MTAPQGTTDITSLDYGKTAEQIAADKNAAEQGFQSTRPVFVDYWGKDITKKFYFPGQEDVPEEYKQYIEYKPMTEGARARFQKKTNRGVVIESSTQNARMGMDPAGDRKALFEESVVDWKFAKGQTLIDFSFRKFMEWYEGANPKIVDDLEREIRENNEWMLNELSSEAIQKEIDNLYERKAEAEKREAREADFDSKRNAS